MPDNRTIATVDTLKAYETLMAARMPDDQARAVVSIVHELQESRLVEVATKTDVAELRADIAELRAELKEEIAELRAELKAEIAELRTELKEEIAELRAELKEEIAELRAELKEEIAELRTETKQDIGGIRTEVKALEARLLKWFIALLLGQTAFLVGILRLLK